MGFDDNSPVTGDHILRPSNMGKKEVWPAAKMG